MRLTQVGVARRTGRTDEPRSKPRSRPRPTDRVAPGARIPYAHARHNDIDDGRSAAPIAGAMRSHGVAPNALLAAGPAVPSKCRTAMVAGDEERTLSVSGSRPVGARHLPALEGTSDERWRRAFGGTCESGQRHARTMPIPYAEPDRGICRSVPWLRRSSAGSVAQQNGVWPFAASRYASAVDVNAFTCRNRAPGQRAAMFATFRSGAPRSTSNDGVGKSRMSTASDVTRVPTRSRDRARRRTPKR
jgi:hypothetical protein